MKKKIRIRMIRIQMTRRAIVMNKTRNMQMNMLWRQSKMSSTWDLVHPLSEIVLIKESWIITKWLL